MKGILFIIDGLGDLPVPELGDRTPLEAAETPVLNALAGRGRYGLIDPIAPGVLPNTHSGAGMLLGMLPGQAESLNVTAAAAITVFESLRQRQLGD